MMPGDELDYPALIHEALIGVVREILGRVAEDGLPGNHHFYLTFRTDHPGVAMPSGLKMRHPETMTIVLQHQFWNLSVEEDVFAVTLRFGGAKQQLTIPFAALTSFIDPDAEFGLQLGAGSEKDDERGLDGDTDRHPESGEEPAAADQTGQVISIDEFRKKTD